MQLMRDAVIPTGLFIEGTEYFSSSFPTNSYYGFNVTKTEQEPIDQIHGFIAAACLEARNKSFGVTGTFYPFIAGIFEVLNTTNREQIAQIIDKNSEKEEKKKELFVKIASSFNLPAKVLVTNDLWGNPTFWETFSKVISSSQGTFSKKVLTRDTLVWYRGREEELERVNKIQDVALNLMNIPPNILNQIGDWPAAIVYTPMEVTEALFLSQQYEVKCKIGHMDETVYDKYILPFMDIIHLRQPTDLKSTRLKPIGVTPYIAKDRRERKLRIYFDDSPDSIRERISSCKIEKYIYTWSPKYGEVLNPILDKLVLAVEAARLMGQNSVKIVNKNFSTGIELINMVAKEDITINSLVDEFPNIIYSYLIDPFI